MKKIIITLFICFFTFSYLYAEKIDLDNFKKFFDSYESPRKPALNSSDSDTFHDDIKSLKRTSLAFNKVAEKGIAAVVSLSVSASDYYSNNSMFEDPYFRYFFDVPRYKSQKNAIGSGVIISKEGYVLTNHHVVQSATKVLVTLADGRELEASFIGSDPKTDLALLKVNAMNLPFVELASSDDLTVGDWAIAIGNPFGLQSTVTVGIISALGRSGVIDTDNYASFIQTDAAINPGNSGGALLNIDGQLIGINTAIFSQSGGYMGIGFAVPASTAKRVVEDLLSYGKVKRGMLGVAIQPINDEIMKTFNLSSRTGALVVDVEPYSSASNAGIEINDIIIELNNKRITDYLSLRSIISELRIGDNSIIKVLRKGRVIDLKFVLLDDPKKISSLSKNTYDKLGLSVEQNSHELQKKLRLFTSKGLVINDVKPGSVSDKSQLRKGYVIQEVNGRQIKHVAEYNKIISGSDIILLTLDVDGYDYQVMLRVK